MTDEWTEWLGGECPVQPKTWGDLRFKNGEIALNQPIWDFDWRDRNSRWDIEAYRIKERILKRGKKLCVQTN